jgi:hypothetical protein
MSTERERRLDAAADRIELTELMHHYAWAIDKWEWQRLDEVFTEDAEVDFSSVGQYTAGDSVLRGRQSIVTWLQTSIKPFPDVLHFMTNQIVTLKGDTAHVTTYMQVLHMPMGGIYHWDAVRTTAGWRIRRFRLEERTFEEAAERLQRHMKAVSGPE